MELFPFDEAYVDRLRNLDQPAEQHFVSYFERLLRIKLRARLFASETVEELRQETLARVIAALRAQGGVRRPERLGAFVQRHLQQCTVRVLPIYLPQPAPGVARIPSIPRSSSALKGRAPDPQTVRAAERPPRPATRRSSCTRATSSSIRSRPTS